MLPTKSTVFFSLFGKKKIGWGNGKFVTILGGEVVIPDSPWLHTLKMKDEGRGRYNNYN